jgi:hypothetical protein
MAFRYVASGYVGSSTTGYLTNVETWRNTGKRCLHEKNLNSVRICLYN